MYHLYLNTFSFLFHFIKGVMFRFVQNNGTGQRKVLLRTTGVFKALFFLILSFVIYGSHRTPKSTLAIPENVIRDAGQIGAQEFLENRSTVNNQIYNQTLGHFVLVLG